MHTHSNKISSVLRIKIQILRRREQTRQTFYMQVLRSIEIKRVGHEKLELSKPWQTSPRGTPIILKSRGKIGLIKGGLL